MVAHGGALVALALVAASCGAGPRASAPPSDAVAFAACMRSNGVSRFPDPGSSGAIPKVGLQQLGISSAGFARAQDACRRFLPNGGRLPSLAAQQLVRANALRFARCVRSHGVPAFPDPGSDGRIPDPARVGIDQGSPKFQVANQACGKWRPPYMPSNAAYDTWARTHPS
jgi:hypothetical protein